MSNFFNVIFFLFFYFKNALLFFSKCGGEGGGGIVTFYLFFIFLKSRFVRRPRYALKQAIMTQTICAIGSQTKRGGEADQRGADMINEV